MYVLLSARSIDQNSFFTVVFRVGFAWSLAFGVGVVADHMKHSALKLLKLLDTLNVRTTELEQTQSQIENIHSNAGTLGEILDLQQLIDKIMDIADSLWGYSLFELMLVNPETDALERVAALENGNKRIFDPREPISPGSVIGQVARSGRAERIVDVRSVPGYIARMQGTRSQMAVPMVSRGKVVGVINAEAKATGKFSDMDQKLVSIFAASAAMAVDNARLHKQVSDLAVIDELTGAYNYRYFSSRLEEERKRSERYGLPISLIMIDVDWFKRMNDTYGHEVGNMVLRELSRVIKECIRDTDLLCRYGGEEFIVILPQTASADARPIGDRIRERVDAHTFGGYGGAPILRTTVSIGVTSYPDNGMQVSDLISAVDSALYRAKGSGKNLVCSV
jgi:diguanylate cyclase (GGDEF)-like protein